MLGQKCLLPLMLTQAVIYLMYRIGKMVALQHITGPVATPCCAGKPKKTIVERLCGLKHAEVSELVILETVQQTISKMRPGLSPPQQTSSPLGWTMHDQDPFHSAPTDSEHLNSCSDRPDALPSTLVFYASCAIMRGTY